MSVFTVTFDGTRFHTADSYTNWGNYGGSGAGGSNEAPLAYQNSLASNRQQKTTGGTLGGLDYDPGAGGLDHTGSTRRLVFVKCYVSDAFDLNVSEGVRITIGSSSANTFKYNMAGSTATNDAHLEYPQQGGYILTAIDVTDSFWPITTTGTFDDTAVDYYGLQGSWIAGTAKAENLAMDSIDVGTGLYITLGTGADPLASFVGYVDEDQGVTTQRWGCCSGAGANVAAWCVLRAGGTVEFFDDTSIVAFKDGYHGAGLTGVLHELDTAAATFDVGCTVIGEGKLYNSGAIDTRPDWIVTGTTMTLPYNLSANIRNFRNITFTSKVAMDGADIECQLLTQADADMENSIIRTNALTNVATLQDPAFAVSSDLNNCEFIQTGVGHAIEIDTAGTYDFQDLTFTGYGGSTGSNPTPSSGAADAAVFNSSGGLVTINVNGDGNQPSVRNNAVSTTVVQQSVTVQITCVDVAGDPIENARVLVETDPGGTAVIDAALTNASGIASASYTASTPQLITGRARKGTVAPYYRSTSITGTISGTGLDLTIQMQDD